MQTHNSELPAVDLRSDTVTLPSPAMRDTMMSAPLGDDVFGDDPTVSMLQERAAQLLGKEAALFVPSGTMANQVCIRSHTEPGDEIIVHATSHIYVYEGGGYAAISGVSIRCVDSEDGLLTAEAVEAAIRPPGGLSHYPITKLVCLENTANLAGGAVYPQQRLEQIGEVARARGLRMHLDGARLFNAAIALGLPVERLAAPFDSISICLSKGLGCPAGSLVIGSRTFIERAHRFRKMLGGGMRQTGVLAAAGLFALEHNIARIADDHERASRLAASLRRIPGVRVVQPDPATNMIYFDIAGTGRTAADAVRALQARGIRVGAVDQHTIRAVTHLDIDDAGIQRAATEITDLLG